MTGHVGMVTGLILIGPWVHGNLSTKSMAGQSERVHGFKPQEWWFDNFDMQKRRSDEDCFGHLASFSEEQSWVNLMKGSFQLLF